MEKIEPYIVIVTFCFFILACATNGTRPNSDLFSIDHERMTEENHPIFWFIALAGLAYIVIFMI